MPFSVLWREARPYIQIRLKNNRTYKEQNQVGETPFTSWSSHLTIMGEMRKMAG